MITQAIRYIKGLSDLFVGSSKMEAIEEKVKQELERHFLQWPALRNVLVRYFAVVPFL